MIDKIVESDEYTPEMNKMVGGMSEVKKLLQFEQIARLDAIRQNESGMVADFNYLVNELEGFKLPTYWHHIGEVLIAKALQYTNDFTFYKKYISGLHLNPFIKLLQKQVK
jgi:hypothetical protein